MGTNDGATHDVTAIVLAGGASTRFTDGDKALASLGEHLFIERVVAAVREGTGRLPLVAVRTDEQQRRYEPVVPDAEFVRDDPEFEGPVAGVFGAIGSVSTAWIFVCAVDMPQVTRHTVRWLGSALAHGNAVAPVHADGTTEPMHTYYRTSAVEAARENVPRDGGVRSLLTALEQVHTVDVAEAPPGVDLAAAVTSVNTRTDLEALRDQARDT